MKGISITIRRAYELPYEHELLYESLYGGYMNHNLNMNYYILYAGRFGFRGDDPKSQCVTVPRIEVLCLVSNYHASYWIKMPRME